MKAFILEMGDFEDKVHSTKKGCRPKPATQEISKKIL